jgi:hypothetical protein
VTKTVCHAPTEVHLIALIGNAGGFDNKFFWIVFVARPSGCLPQQIDPAPFPEMPAPPRFALASRLLR